MPAKWTALLPCKRTSHDGGGNPRILPVPWEAVLCKHASALANTPGSTAQAKRPGVRLPAQWAAELAEVYADVEEVDFLVGCLAESPRPKGYLISETAFYVFIMNASRRLLCDRFYQARGGSLTGPQSARSELHACMQS